MLRFVAPIVGYLEPRYRPAVFAGRSPVELSELAVALPDDLAADLIQSLLSELDPEVNFRNYRAALDLALILFRTGERERADQLLDRSLEPIQKRPRGGWYGSGIADVQLYTLRGERQNALSGLRQAVEAGWRRDWWYQLQHKPDLEPLHGDREYQALVEEIRADMAAQLKRVREMEARGELVLAAEAAAPSDRRAD